MLRTRGGVALVLEEWDLFSYTVTAFGKVIFQLCFVAGLLQEQRSEALQLAWKIDTW
jgi:hypothetical protein